MRQRKSLSVLAAIFALAALLAPGAGPSAWAANFSCTWTNAANGTWNVLGNWSTCNGAFPNNGADTFDATIAAAGPSYTVTLNSGVTIGNFTLNSANATVNHTSGTLTVTGIATLSAGTYTLNGGTIQGGTWNVNPGATFSFSSLANTLSGVTVNGDLTLNTGSARTQITNGTTFQTAHLSASGSGLAFSPGSTLNSTIQFETAGTNSQTVETTAAGTLTIGVTGVIKTAAGFNNGTGADIGGHRFFSGETALTNQGTISAETLGGNITINPTTNVLGLNTTSFTNTGTVQALNGGLVTISAGGTVGSWINAAAGHLTVDGAGSVLSVTGTGTGSNAGTITATNGSILTIGGSPWSNTGTISSTNSTVNLGGTFTNTGLGTFNRTGGTVNLTGTFDNSGHTFTFDNTTGAWIVNGGTIQGGALNFANGQTLLFSSAAANTLSGVTVNGDLTLNTGSARTQITNGTTFQTAHLSASGSGLAFSPGSTLNSTIQFETAGTNSQTVETTAAGTLTIGVTGVIKTAAGFNNGTGADIGGHRFFSGETALTNQGTISAETLGGNITINPTTNVLGLNTTSFTNTGTVQALNGGLVTISAGGTVGSWINAAAGHLTVDGAGSVLSVTGTGTGSNAGTITATNGSILTIGGSPWSNTGTISSTNSTVNLGGTFTNTGLGTFNRTGGTVNLTGTFDNSGHTFTFDNTTGAWIVNGGTIQGGALNFANGQTLLFSSAAANTLSGVTVNGDLTLNTSSARTQITNGTTFQTAHLSASGSGLAFSPGSTLNSTIQFETAGTNSQTVETTAAGTLTIGVTGVIKTAAGFNNGTGADIGGHRFFSGETALTNQGTISAETLGGNITINPTTNVLGLNTTSFTNTGTVQALNGGLVTISAGGTVGSWINAAAGHLTVDGAGSVLSVTGTGTGSNAGTITATNGSILTIGGSPWSNTGTISSTNSTVNLGGTFTNTGLGTFNRTGGTVNLTGTFDNSGHTFTFDNTTGAWIVNGGTIQGGALNFANGQTLLFSSAAANTLSGVTVNGDLTLNTGSARTQITNGTTFQTAHLSASGSGLAFSPGSTLNSTIQFETASTNSQTVETTAAGTLTIGVTGVIKTAAGFNNGTGADIGGHRFFSGETALTNQGTISAETLGGNITINPTTNVLGLNTTSFTNTGTVQALNGGLVTISAGGTVGSWINAAAGHLTVDGAGSVLSVTGTGTGSNAGTITATNGSILTIGGSPWSNTGTISSTNSTVNLGGTFTNTGLGTFNRTGGTVNLTGTFDNSGHTFTFDNTTGAWIVNGGTIQGGALNFANGQTLLFSSAAANTLSGVTVNGDLTLNTGSARTQITNGTTFQTAHLSATGSDLAFSPGSTLNGTIQFETASTNSQTVETTAAGTLTIGATGVIRTAAGFNNGTGADIGGHRFFSGNTALTNQGLISAETAGGNITINPATSFSSTGTVQALNGGLVDIPNGITLTNNSGGTLTGGTWKSIGNGSSLTITGGQVITNAADITLSGVGSIFRAHTGSSTFATLESSLTTNAAAGALRVFASRNYTTANAFSNAGIIELGNGTFTAASLVNNPGAPGSEIFGFGTLAIPTAITGNSQIRAAGGPLVVQNGMNGSGATARSDAGGTLSLGTVASSPSTVGFLVNNGALNLNTNNITVNKDYTNANFGTGNAFNARANVIGTGQIIGSNASQTITGSVIAGAPNQFTIDFGAIRGSGSGTVNYQIANNGTGADIRGAIQTSSIDPRLSGSGVTAGNFGPIVAGANSGNLAITVTGGNTGGALTGTLQIVSNFSNVATQTITLNGTTSVLAVGDATPNPNPLNLGNFRIGTPGAVTNLAVQNTTNVTGAEQLGINSVTPSTGFSASNVLGSSLIAPGATQAGAVTVSASGTGSAGVNTGTIAIQYASDGTNVNSTFTRQSANLQTINVAATGYNAAVGSTTPSPITIGNQRVGGIGTQLLTVSNTAAAGVFSEALNASFSGATAGITNNGGSVTNLIAGGNNNSAMSVGVNTATAGAKSGSVTIAYQTDGTGPNGNSGLVAIDAGSQLINVSGNVYQIAQPSVPASVNVGNVHVGGSASQAMVIGNTNIAPAGFQEGLNASVGGTSGGATGSGSMTNLAAGSTSNAISVGLNVGAAGAQSGAVTLNLASNGTLSGLSDFSLGTANVSVQATGYNLAVASVAPSPVTLANQRVGGTLAQALTVANTAPVNATFTETLSASFGANTGNATNNLGTVSGIAGGANNSSALQVGVNTSAAGARTGTVTVNLTSNEVNSSGLGNTALTAQAITVSGNVYQVAQPTGLPGTVDLGNFRAGAGAQSQSINITNTNVAPGFQEGLNAAINSTAGQATATGFNNVAAGASGNLVVGLSGINAGNNSGTVQVQLQSNGTGTSGLGNLNLGGAQTVNVTGTGWRLAAANTQPATINFGNVLVNSVQAQFLNIQNTAIADGFSEKLDASFKVGGTTGDATNNGGSIGLLAAGASNNAAMSVGVSTATIGGKSGQVIVAFNSNGSGTSSLGITALPDQAIGILANVQANVGTLAQPSAVTPNPVNFGNFRVGAPGAGPQNLSISNLAVIGEGLNASIATGSSGFSAAGAFASLAPGATDNTSLQVSFNGTGTAGAKSGTATITLVSDGTFNGGTPTVLTPQTVNMNANVFNMAVGSTTPSPITIGNQRVGGIGTQLLTVSNTAAAGVFSEALNASFSGATAGITNNGGSVTNLIAGGNNNSAMSVGVNTATAGAKSGSVTIAYQTDGTGPNGNSGLVAIDAGSQLINVSGNVYQIAQPSVPASVNVGNVHVGGSASQAMVIGNTNIAPAGFQEGLNASVGGTSGGATGSGSMTNLAAGSTSNAISVGLNVGAAGAQSGAVTLNLASNGTLSGLSDFSLGTANVSVQATGYNLAVASVAPSPVTLANQRVGGTLAQALTVANTAPVNATFTETLSASFGANTGNATNNLGTVSGIAGGANNSSALQVGVNTSAAGARTGTVTVNLTSNEVNSSGLGNTALTAQAITVSGNVYQVAQPTGLPGTVDLGNFRAGAGAQSQSINITNTNVAPGFQEGLNAAINSTAGQATATGFNNVAAGASGNLVVGLSGINAGNNSGTVQVQLQSNGTGTSGLGNLNLGGAQTVNVTGTGWRLAAANTQPATINFGNVLVNSVQAQFLNVQNTAIADGFSEKLDASFKVGGTTGDATNNGGSIGLLAAGASNNAALSVGVSTATIGGKSGQVIVAFNSNGSGTSGLGITALPDQAIGILANVQANVGTLAQPSAVTPNPVNFGNFRVGAPGAGPQNLSISNLAVIGEGLNASIATGSSGFSAAGAFASLAPGATDNTSLQVSFNGTGTAGAKSGAATITLVSDGTFNGGTPTVLTPQTVNMNANVYQVAQPSGLPATVNVGAFRTSGSPVTQAVTLTNTNIAPAGFQEGLNATIAGTGGAGAASGALNNVAAGNSGNLQIGVAGVAGVNTGTVQVQLATNGTGTSGLGTLNLGGPQTVNVTGTGYTTAQATVQPSVNFGIVHVGDVVAAQGVSVQNTAPVTALNDTLKASIGGATGPFTSSGGPVSGLTAGGPASTALAVGLNTAAAGVYSGTATVGLTSQNADMADLALSAATVALTGTVNNYANAVFEKVSGGGSLSRSGNAFTLDFGSVVQGASALSAVLDVQNLVSGPADLLDGSLIVVDGNDFTTLLNSAFADVVAGGSSADLLQFLFNTAALGSFTDTIDLTWHGHNASGFQGGDNLYTLNVIGNVIESGHTVPEPSSLLLLTIALAGLGVSRRRKRV